MTPLLKKCIVAGVAIFAAAACAPAAGAQEVALKTNLFYDATATANLGAEVAVAPRWSIDLSGP